MRKPSSSPVPLASLAGFGVLLSGLIALPGIALSSSGPWKDSGFSRVLSTAASSNRIELEVKDVIQVSKEDGHAVMLLSEDGTLLPVFVDESAAVAIAFRLAKLPPPHPFAEDLLDQLVQKMGGKVTEVNLVGSDSPTRNSEVQIRQGRQTVTLPARASDSIAMALSSGAKIYATQNVLATSGISRAELDALRGQLGHGGSGPPGPQAPSSPTTPERPAPKRFDL